MDMAKIIFQCMRHMQNDVMCISLAYYLVIN